MSANFCAETLEYQVPGLSAPVDVLVDESGVPHLYASCENDLFVAQGFNAARERLFQLDLWRRRGLGRLAEVFGPRFIERDRAARLFLFRGDLHAEWLAYGSSTKRVVTAFVDGINAFVNLCQADESLLPIEFRELGYRPAHWDPVDVVRVRSHALFYNVEQEVARARTLRDFGVDVENIRAIREPPSALVIPEGLDLTDIPDEVLDIYRLATTPPTFGHEDQPHPRSAPEGSNSWVLGPTRTATGRPLLANDPHRSLDVPSLRYLVHLSAPGLDVIGAGEPALPGISIGHNGHIAFGLTIFAIDQEDLYVYETNPEAPDEYRYRGRWEPMRVIRETINVADDEPVEIELWFTRHGPVIHSAPERNRAFAVRAAWLEPGMSPYLGSIDYMRTRTPDEFVDAMNRWGAPGENQVYAAPDGTIGWRPAGLVPIRPNWDGTIPVPGDGRYEWAGFYDADQLPAQRNPARDWIATANEMNLPTDYPNHERTVSYDWPNSYRYRRIAEVLESANSFSLDDCVALQTDTVNVSVRPVLRALAGWLGDADIDPTLKEMAGWLCQWNGDERADSAEAALYHVWIRRHLRPALLRNALRSTFRPPEIDVAVRHMTADEPTAADTRTDLLLLDRLNSNSKALARVFEDSLNTAVQETYDLLGSNRATWRWGDLHYAAPEHPLAATISSTIKAKAPINSATESHSANLGRVPRPGGADTVCSTPYDDRFRQKSGASFRMVIDVGEWDNSVAMNAPGQSGRPDDPHYTDLYQPWASGATFALHYSREVVEAHTSSRHRLTPP